MGIQQYLIGLIFLLLCLTNGSYAQIKKFNEIKFIKPFIYSLDEKATKIQPVDRKNKMTEFGQVVSFYENIDRLSLTKCGIISKSGQFILPKIFRNIDIWNINPELAFVHGTNYAIYNLKDKKWIDSYDNIQFNLSRNLAYFTVSKNNEDYVLNKDCKIVFHKPGYEIYEIVNNELIILKNKMTSLFGVYDLKKNKFVIEDKFFFDKPYKFNAFIVKENRLYYLYTFNGEKVNNIKYIKYKHEHGTDIGIFQEVDGDIKILNSSGNEIEKGIQDSLLNTSFKYFQAKTIKSDEYSYDQEFRVNRKSYFIVMNLNGKYSIIDENNENIISFDYDFIDMRNGKFISNKNGEFELFEIIDGKILSLEKTKNARIITSDLNFLLAKNDLFETIKNESKVFLPYPIKAVKRVLWDKSFKETYLIQDAKGKWSVFYEDNRSKEEYDDVSIFNELQDNSMLPIRYINISKNGLWGLIDLKGNEVVKPIFEEIIRTDFDYLVVKNKNKYGIFNVKTKQYIFEPTYDFIMFISPYKYYAEKDGEQFYLTF